MASNNRTPFIPPGAGNGLPPGGVPDQAVPVAILDRGSFMQPLNADAVVAGLAAQLLAQDGGELTPQRVQAATLAAVGLLAHAQSAFQAGALKRARRASDDAWGIAREPTPEEQAAEDVRKAQRRAAQPPAGLGDAQGPDTPPADPAGGSAPPPSGPALVP